MRLINLFILCSTFLFGGCVGLVNSTISGGQNPNLPNQIQMGENISAGRLNYTTTKPFPLKVLNMEVISMYSKEMKAELETYFEKRGDFPEINIQIRPASPEMDNGFSGGYHAFLWKFNYEAEIILKDWETPSDIVLELSTKPIQIVASSKIPIGGSFDVLGIMKRAGTIGYHNLAVDIVSQLDSRRAEIDKLAKRFSSWKNSKRKNAKTEKTADEPTQSVINVAPPVDEFAALIAKNNPEELKTYLDEHPEALSTIKDITVRLRYTGPSELRIIDIEQMAKSGTKDALIIAQINSVGGPYKKFSVKEITALKQMKISDELVSAMIAITTEYNKEQKSLKEPKHEPVSQQAAPLLVQQVAQQSVQQQPEPAPATTPMDCIKLGAALKACDHAGGFLSFGCKALARSQFNCPGL